MGQALRRPWMMQSLLDLFPGDWPDAGDPQLEKFVRGSMTRAASHGFEGDDDLAWAALEHVLGEDFPTRPEHAWAAALLADRSVPRSTTIQLLREEAIMRLANPPLLEEASS